MPAPMNLFLTCPPGLEPVLAQEAEALGLPGPKPEAGGIVTHGHWNTVYKANLWLRGATRVLIRMSAFRAMTLGQLEARLAKVDWERFIGPDVPVRVEASCKGSRLHHGGAVGTRVQEAVRQGTGAPIAEQAEGALRLFARIDDNLCTLSLDTSGALLHRRGHKQFTGKAPLRETLAALFLRACGYDGTEPVLDPLCGSGTVPIEAAEIALGLAPGRDRSFGFEQLPGHDPARWAAIREDGRRRETPDSALRFDGRDRDAGAITGARGNAERAGVTAITRFEQGAVSALAPPPEGIPGLIFINPPYGGRIGKVGALKPLYASIGQVLTERFQGWRVGMITTDAGLAKATGLPFAPPSAPIPHGGLRIKLWQTEPLG